jgi:transposase
MPHGRFIFVDETGMNTDLARRYGRAPKGERAHGLIPRNTPKNLSLVGAMGKNGILCSMELEGAIDGDAFLVFIEEVLGPHLRRGDFVVMDNLNTHCSPKVEAALYARGAFLLFLPRYSPDMNPIEKAWSKLKIFLRGVAARTPDALRAALSEGLLTITTSDAQGWFRHAGYLPA